MNEQDTNTNQTNVVNSSVNGITPNTGVVPQQASIDNTTQMSAVQNVTPQPVAAGMPQPVVESTPQVEVTQSVQPTEVLENTTQMNVTPQPVATPQVAPQTEVLENTTQINTTQTVTPRTEMLDGTTQKINVNAVNNDNQNTQTSSNAGDANTTKNTANYKPPGVFKTFVLIVFFAGLVAFIVFLPEIQAFVAEYRSGEVKNNEITTGKLVCKLETNTTNLDKSFERVFNYTDKKLESAKFTTVIKGDITQDEATLDDLNDKCKMIKDSVMDVPGITVTCDYSAGLLTEKETFNYKEYDIEKIKAAYTEAGGEVIEYEYGYDIDKVQTTMLQGGFTCTKER